MEQLRLFVQVEGRRVACWTVPGRWVTWQELAAGDGPVQMPGDARRVAHVPAAGEVAA